MLDKNSIWILRMIGKNYNIIIKNKYLRFIFLYSLPIEKFLPRPKGAPSSRGGSGGFRGIKHFKLLI
jgi:hypothetical protein